MTKKRQTKVETPAQVPEPVKADDSLFRSDLRRLEKNNLEYFGGGKPPASRFGWGDGEEDEIEIKKKEN